MKNIRKYQEHLEARAGAGKTAPLSPTPAASAPSSPPLNTNNVPAGDIHRERIVYRKLTPGEPVTSKEEKWIENGNVREADELSTRIITGSGEVAKPSEIKGQCSNCGGTEKDLIRCEVSHVAICHKCKRLFQRPDGSEIYVSKAELPKLKAKFNTWEKYDHRREGSTRTHRGAAGQSCTCL